MQYGFPPVKTEVHTCFDRLRKAVRVTVGFLPLHGFSYTLIIGILRVQEGIAALSGEECNALLACTPWQVLWDLVSPGPCPDPTTYWAVEDARQYQGELYHQFQVCERPRVAT